MPRKKEVRKKKLLDENSDKRSPDDVDKYVGKRVRMRRSLLRLSQTNLADAVNITFQQVQKYERGANRISAGRLYQFSKILDVPVTFFFEGYEDGKKTYGGLADNKQESYSSDDIMNSRESMEVLRTYYSISDDEKRRKDFLKIIKKMAENWSG